MAELDGDGRVIGLEEKPRQPKSDLVPAGIYLFIPAIHEAVASIRPSGRGELEITDALQRLIDHGRSVHSSVISGYWKDIGNVPDMREANRFVLETVDAVQEGHVDGASTVTGRVRIGAGAKIVASHVVGPVVIGPGTEVIGSSIGPYTSVSEDCRIEDSEISGSIVLRGCVLTGVARIEESLMGLETARWLAGRGARRLVLASRRPFPPRSEWDRRHDPVTHGQIEALRALEGLGVTVAVVSLDITDAEQARKILSSAELGPPPIR